MVAEKTQSGLSQIVKFSFIDVEKDAISIPYLRASKVSQSCKWSIVNTLHYVMGHLFANTNSFPVIQGSALRLKVCGVHRC